MRIDKMSTEEIISIAIEVATGIAAAAEAVFVAEPTHATAQVQILLMSEEKDFYPHNWRAHKTDRDTYVCEFCKAAKRGNSITLHGCTSATSNGRKYAQVVARELRRHGERMKRRWAAENQEEIAPKDFRPIVAAMSATA